MQLPSSLPDETLFSRYVRHMTILGVNEQDYLKTLLNKPRASIHPYLTIGICEAARICEESVSKIYREQTLGRFFSYFLPQHAESISKALFLSNGSNAIRASQLVSFKESETLSLKFCPVCANEDMKNFGVTYWHRIHQVPGVEACPEHKVWLKHEKLPDRPHVKPLLLPKHSTIAQQCTELSFLFARFTKQFLCEISDSNNFFSLAELIENLHERGYIFGNKRFKRKELTSDLYNFIQDLKHTSASLLPNSDEDYCYLSYLLAGVACQHPFKYLLVLFWLDNTLENGNKPSGGHSERKLRINDKSKLCRYLLEQGNSMAEVSRITGKSRCYLKTLARKNNIPIALKPKVITDEVISAVISMAYKGFHRTAIAKEFHVSTGSIEQIISSEDGLVEKRKRYKFESKRRKYKAQILRALRDNPTAIKQDIKNCCYAAFHWLYAHERSWLNRTLPPPSKPHPPPKVDWKKRDRELVTKVRAIMSNSCESISRSQLDEKLGGHGWLIRYQHKLPVTIAFYQKRNKAYD